MFFVRVLDKLVFAFLLLATLQVPILADHYRQYLTGYTDATKQQVAGYQQLADSFGFSSIDRLINSLKTNPDPIIQADAQQKAETVTKLQELEAGLATLKKGNYFSQAWYMFQPERFDTLDRVLDNFRPSIPLTPMSIGASIVTAIVLYMIFIAPFITARMLYRRRANLAQ